MWSLWSFIGIWVFKTKLRNMPEDIPLLQTVIHFTWTCRRSGEKSKLRGNWWNFDLRWAVWAQAEWIRCVPVSYSVYFYYVCVCVYCLHSCVLISVIIDSPNHQFALLWLSSCAACVFKVNAAQLINIDKAHLAICRMLWKQQWSHFVNSTLVFHLSEWCIISLCCVMHAGFRMYYGYMYPLV